MRAALTSFILYYIFFTLFRISDLTLLLSKSLLSFAVSLSQQNSPRRSLIPQPTYRQRSTSLTKVNERSPSPKIGRRVDSKTRLNVSNSRSRLNAADSKTRLNDSRTRLNKSDSKSRTNFAESKTRFISNSTSNLSSNSTTMRRQATTKASTRLSPIQGTPTKPENTTSQSNIRSRNSTSRQSTMKTSKMSPQKNNVATTRRDNQNRNSSKERVLSPSKIPLKTNGSSNTSRFISVPEQSSERFVKMDKTGKAVAEGKSDKQTANQSLQNGRSPEPNSKENEINGNSSDNMDQKDLINLLKQTSQTTGTSSERLVNTTTTTAVQPLHIDANTLLVEPNQQKERSEGMSRSVSPASKGESPVPVSTQNTASMYQKSVENQSVKVNQTSNNPGSDNKDSSVSAESNVGHTKSGSIGQSTKIVRMNGEDSTHQRSNQSSANQRSGRNSQNARGSKSQSDGKTPEEPEMMEVKSGSAGSKIAASGEIPMNDKMPTVMENDSKIARTAEEAETAMSNAATVNNTKTMNNKTASNNNNNNVNSAIGAVNASVNSGAVTRTRNGNRGSDASLKSSTGASTGSIQSVRSTDTGVSVNTVRGVSSPREKTGVHMVKRPQEIETLSGNIVHIEQNGEPT